MVLAAVPCSGQDRLPSQTVSNDLQAPFAAGGFGENALGLGDLDGDGFADYVVVAPGAALPLGGANNFGVAYIYSGRRGTVARTMLSDQFGADFGHAMASIGDVNGDGVHDVAITSPRYDANGLGNNGRVAMYSGLTGQVLWTADGGIAGLELGSSLAATPDLTGDGVPDLVSGETGFGQGLIRRGRARFLNGANGSTFGFADGPVAFASLGATAAGTVTDMAVFMGDEVGRIYRIPAPVLGVSIPVLFQNRPVGSHTAAQLAMIPRPGGGQRLLTGRPTLSTGGNLAGSVELLDLGGQRVFRRLGSAVAGGYGANIGRGRDLDGDGVDEVLAAGTGGLASPPAFVDILRQDGSIQDTRVTNCPAPPQLASIADTSGDGRGELIFALASGFCARARADVFAYGLVATSAGANPNGSFAATFAIDLGVAQAGRSYWQLYGTSGTVPGFLGPNPWPLVPLNLDETTNVMDQISGSPITPNSKGTLDLLGRTTTTLQVPAAVAQLLSGIEVSTCVVAMDPNVLAVFAASNPLEIVLP